MKELSILIKPASSLCNMRCRYCFYGDISDLRQVKSFGLMEQATADALIDNALFGLQEEDSVTFLFQGGEPTLAGLPFFEAFVQQVQKREPKSRISYCLQTNGLLIDESWCRFLKQHHFLVGISLDGFAQLHDENRLDAAGKGTQKRVRDGLTLLQKYHVDVNLLWVLTQQLSGKYKRVWEFLEKNDIEYVQFIPCLAPLEEGKVWKQSLSPQGFSRFYTGLFDLWSKALDCGKYRSIKFFDDLFNLLLYHRVTACGFTGQCHSQLVVEADGSVYPCDFYATEQWCIGNIKNDSIDSLLAHPKAREFENRPKPEAALCSDCDYRRFCGGGCPRMFREMYVEDGFCGYRDFLNRRKAEINRIAAYLYQGGSA